MGNDKMSWLGFGKKLLSQAGTYLQKLAKQPSDPILTTSETHPELIQEVVTKLEDERQALFLVRLQELEKAVYHLAGRQKEVLEKIDQMEALVVSMATTLEELLHDLGVGEEEANPLADESDEVGWTDKKKEPTLN